jgi:two-component system sensor histidine kinase YesM
VCSSDLIVSPQAEDIKLPPLIIQPLVENSIVHGFQNSKGASLFITVEIEKSDGFLIICVRDNGKGFTSENLEYLKNAVRRKEHAPRDDSKHIGIQNVHLRLEMFFGEDIEMEFGGSPGGGAVVRVKVPLTAI